MPGRPSVPQSSLPVIEDPFLARNLFSYHFLKERLPHEDPRWRRDERQNQEVFNLIKKLYQRVQPASKEQYRRNEANLEKDFIRPILNFLGHSYDVQESIHFSYRGPERPDYTLFPSEEIRRAAEGDSEKYLTSVIALAEAKAWDLELDKTAKVGPARYANPSLQINNYLRDANISWGILTNGRKWRLYNKETSLHLDSYYEVDLVELIERGSPEDFKYFYLLFRREAFVREAPVPSFLDDVFTGSIRYAKELEEDVKDNIYEALRLLIKGFLEHPDNRLDATDLERIHENSLILLYRLLFVLYAEAKGLLPSRDPLYRDMSLERLREDIKREQDKAVPTLTVAGDSFWARLAVLFRLVNLGSEARNIPREHLFIPPYNGGLFDPTRHPFLETSKVGDKYLAQAVHLLSWSSGRNGRQAGFVDYTTLSIRHLGSIYEGLLEYRPLIAEDDLVVVKEKGREVFKKISEVHLTPKQLRRISRIDNGDVYLRTDKGERKATGSYYTPDYVVKHVVEATLSPLVEDIRAKGMKGTDFVREVLSLNVLDPAMGSGHFLVEATSFLASKIVESLAEAGEGTEPAEPDVLWARREVARRCIYGVDINPLAVELAKVSLWLHTVTKDKPLSFLDHHLKCGNSLVGTHLVDLPWYPEERKEETTSKTQRVDLEGPKPFINKLLEAVRRLELTPDETLQQVKEKERTFEELKETSEYQKIKTLCDVRAAIFLGGQVSRKDYQDFAAHVFYGSRADWESDQRKPWLRHAEAISQEVSCFHWELEFPEVFFEGGLSKPNPGFDVVLGNPPYVRQEGIVNLKSYLASNFETFEERADVYVYFLEQGIDLCRKAGRFGVIVSDKWLRAKYGRRIRAFIKENARSLSLLAFGELPVFEEAGTFPCIMTIAKGVGELEATYMQIRELPTGPTLELMEMAARTTFRMQELDPSGPWVISPEAVDMILSKIRACSHPLTTATGRTPLVGIKTGRNQVFVVSEEIAASLTANFTREVEIVKPYLLGDDVRRYFTPPTGHYVIFPYERKGNDLVPVDLARYPSIQRYLEKHRETLESRAIIRDLIAHSPGEWFTLQQVNKTIDFTKPKLVYPDISKECRFCLDRKGVFVDMTCFVLETDSLFIVAILNSTLGKFIFGRICAVLGDVDEGGRLRFKTQYVSSFPIRTIESTTPRETFKTALGELKALYESNVLELQSLQPYDDILRRVSELLGHESVHADVVREFLCHLSSMMKDFHETQHGHTQNFLRWVESPSGLGVEVRELTGKTKFLQFQDHPEIGSATARLELENVLARNSVTMSPAKLARLRSEYEATCSGLIPLKQRISRTEILIDAIVYSLYGLRLPDVALVEGLTLDQVRSKYGIAFLAEASRDG